MSRPIYFSGTTVYDRSQYTLPSVADKYVALSSMSAAERRQVFGLWLGIVYVNRTPPPAPLAEGFVAEEDPIIMMDFHSDYEAGAWRELGRGHTMEEAWLSYELSLGEQFMCVVNSAAPAQPMERIERKIVCDAAETVETALMYFWHKAGERRRPMTALVTDGEFGHCITLADADPAGNRFAFYDPWPYRSLLCEENNAAGVKASSLGKTKLHFPDGRTANLETWQLSREELTRVLVALMIPMRQWTELVK